MNETKNQQISESANQRTGESADRRSRNQDKTEQVDPIEAALKYKVAQINPDPNFVTRLAMQLRRARKLRSTPAPRRVPLWGWLGAAIATVLVVTFAAQALLPGGEKLPAGTPEIAQALPTATAQPAVTTAPAATETVAPTPEPEPAFAADLPPAVVAAVPRPGEEVHTRAGILLRFSRAMNRASVETALRVTPEVEGTFDWQDDTTVTFTPKVLAAGTRYNVALDVTAQADNGLPLTSDLAFSFSTLDALTVTHTTPMNDSIDLRGDVPVLIAFNHPMVPINCTGQVADTDCPPLPLTFNPGVVGQGTWINTSVYRFDPLPAWDAGTTYTAQLPAGVNSVAGATLNEAVTWTFSTAQAKIVRIEPNPESTNTPLETGVRVTFNTPMNAQATAIAFSLSAASGAAIPGAAVPGAITWEDNNATLVFTPTQNLALDTHYVIRVTDQASAVNGGALETGQEVSFKTVPYPAVVSITGTDESTSGDTLSHYESLRVQFQGLIDADTLEGHFRLTENDVPTEFNFWWDNYEGNNTAYIDWDKTPAAEYCLTVLPGIADRYGNIMTEETTACFTGGDMPIIFIAATRQNTVALDAAEAARLYFAAVNAPRVALTLSTMAEYNFLDYEGAPQNALRRWTLALDSQPNRTALVPVDLTEDGNPLPTGYYHIEWTVPGTEHWWSTSLRFAVVDRHVTLKMGATEALVWVTDLRSAQPVAGAPVRLLDRVGNQIGAGVTDADGIARFAIPMQQEQWDNYTAVTGTPGQPGFGVARRDWNQGVSPWDFDLQVEYLRPVAYQVYLQTDRPIYRPAQTVAFKGILRTDNDARYTLPPAGQTVDITIRNPYWEIITQTQMTVNEMGTFSGEIPLTADAMIGAYALEAMIPGDPDRTWSLYFTVAAYRKPEFEVTVAPEQKEIFDGETLRALIEAQYYSGGPVSNASIHWVVRATAFYFSPDVPGWWSWGAGDTGWTWSWEPKVIAEGDAVTDSTGRFMLELPAALAALSDSATTVGSQSWSVEATVTDEVVASGAGFPVTNKGALTVHATRFYLGLKPRSWVVQAGQKATVDLLALDWDAQPVSGQDVTISLARRTWKYIPAKEPFSSPTWAHTDEIMDTRTVTTDAAGKAEIVLTPPRSGPYVVLAERQDSSGKTVRSETYLWVSGPEAAAWQMPEGQIKPVADAQSYRIGDTARVLLPTPFSAPYEVLMTVERSGILSVQRFTAQETNPLIEIPIVDAYVPNIIVSFVAIKGVDATNPAPDVRIGMVELKVEPVEKTLTVEVTLDRDTAYEPGDRATLTIRTLDYRGQPVQAEVALAIVDKAVLALADPNAPTLLEAFYKPRPLGVFTGDGLIALFNRTAANIEALKQTADHLAKEMLMGGIGGGGGDGMYMADVRQDYPDTALWQAHLQTGADGTAQVSLDLPDSLTTWVADARAIADARIGADTLVGQTTTEFVVSKALFVRPVTPRFFVAGDRAEVAAVVHNNTDADVDVDVSLDTNLRISESANVLVSVPAHGQVQVSWMVEVPGSEEVAWLTFSAEGVAADGTRYSDAARPTVGRESDHALPIYRYETPAVFSTSGALTEAGSRLEAVVIPPDAGPDSYLTVRLEPTLAAGMTEGLTYLEYFPHACTEQLVSRFLPNVVSYRALSSLGVHNPELEANLQRLIAEALTELYARQMEDDGWGWWRDSSDTQVTAYVAFALIQTQRAGFPISENKLHRALTYLDRALTSELKRETRTLPEPFALYVLAEGGSEWPAGADEVLFEARDQLDVTGRAYLALALGLKDPADPRVATLLEDLRADVAITARGAHWESDRADADSEYWVTSTRATSVALDALARLAPDDPLIPQVTRWLMIARTADRWETTQETAWAIIALTDVMLATGELQADYAWGAAVNTEPQDEGQVTPENLRDPVEITIPVSELLREWPNAVEISRSEGNGTLYYSANLAIYRPVEQLEAESRGITVQRQYCAVADTLDTLAWNENFGDCTPVNSAQPGDLVEVRLTLTLPRLRNYLVVEDFYPAGMEPVDPTLNTEIQEGVEPETRRINTGDVWWWPTFDHEELRDERAVFYARWLAAGTYEVRYFLRAAIPGEYRVLPATANEMYFPDVRGRSAGELFTISN